MGVVGQMLKLVRAGHPCLRIVTSEEHQARAARRDLTSADVLTALQTSPPLSVTMAERMADLREWAKGRCVPAD